MGRFWIARSVAPEYRNMTRTTPPERVPLPAEPLRLVPQEPPHIDLLHSLEADLGATVAEKRKLQAERDEISTRLSQLLIREQAAEAAIGVVRQQMPEAFVPEPFVPQSHIQAVEAELAILAEECGEQLPAEDDIPAFLKEGPAVMGAPPGKGRPRGRHVVTG